MCPLYIVGIREIVSSTYKMIDALIEEADAAGRRICALYLMDNGC